MSRNFAEFSAPANWRHPEMYCFLYNFIDKILQKYLAVCAALDFSYAISIAKRLVHA